MTHLWSKEELKSSDLCRLRSEVFLWMRKSALTEHIDVFFFAIVCRKVILQHFKVSFWNFRDQSVHFSGYKIIIKLLLLSILKTLLHFKIYNMILLISENFKLKHGLNFLKNFLWKSRLSSFTKFVIWVFCRPQRAKWNLMGCIKSNSVNLKFFLSQQMLPRCYLNFSTDS